MHDDLLKFLISPRVMSDSSLFNFCVSILCKLVKVFNIFMFLLIFQAELAQRGMASVRPVVNSIVSKMYSLQHKQVSHHDSEAKVGKCLCKESHYSSLLFLPTVIWFPFLVH